MIVSGRQTSGDRAQITLTTPLSTVSTSFSVTIRSSSKLKNFSVGKISFTNCSLSSFTEITKQYWTVFVTPTIEGQVTISVAQNVSLTYGGKSNEGSNVLSIVYDSGSLPPADDYLFNLYDEWAGNRGFIPNSNLTTALKWNGYINGIICTTGGNLANPVSSVYTWDGSNDVLNLSTSLNPAITGNITACFLIQQTSSASHTVILFDSNTNSPRLRCYLEISGANNHMGIAYNGTIYDAGVSFPFGASYHLVSFRVDGINNVASIWIDDTKVSSDITITGGGLNCNTGQTLWMFAGIGVTNSTFNALVKKIRIYTEAVSDDNMALIGTGPIFDTIEDLTPYIVVIHGGQSNVAPGTGDNVIENYPSELQTEITGGLVYNITSNANEFLPLTPDNLIASSPSSPGPILKFAYDGLADNPGSRMAIIRYFVGGTAMYNKWKVGAPLLTTLLSRTLVMMKTLEVEQRPISQIVFFFIQGESDAYYEAYANDYYTNLVGVYDELRTNYGVTKCISMKLSSQTVLTYKDIVRQAFDDVVNPIDPNYNSDNFNIDTDNPTDFPMLTGNLHFTTVGLCKIGEVGATYL